MTAELGVGFALRAVNERVQQSVARRPRVRTGRRGLGPGWKGDTYVGRGVTVTQKGLPEGRGLQKGSLGFPGGLALRIRTCPEVGLVGERCLFRISDSYPGVSPFVIALGITTPFVTTVLEPWEGRIHPRSRALRRPGTVV